MNALLGKRPPARRIALLAILLVLVLLRAVTLKHRESPVPQPAAGEPSAASAPALWAKQRGQEERLKQPWGRNPFLAAGAEAQDFHPAPERPGELTLTGILVRGERRVAIINHFFLAEGEVIDNAQVVRIEKDRVIVKRAGEETVLRLEGV